MRQESRQEIHQKDAFVDIEERFREIMENTLAILGYWPDKNQTKKNFGKLGDGNFVGRSFRHFEWKKWVWKMGGNFFYFDNIYIS